MREVVGAADALDDKGRGEIDERKPLQAAHPPRRRLRRRRPSPGRRRPFSGRLVGRACGGGAASRRRRRAIRRRRLGWRWDADDGLENGARTEAEERGQRRREPLEARDRRDEPVRAHRAAAAGGALIAARRLAKHMKCGEERRGREHRRPLGRRQQQHAQCVRRDRAEREQQRKRARAKTRLNPRADAEENPEVAGERW